MKSELHWIYSDKLKRKLFIKNEIIRKILKVFIRSTALSYRYKFYLYYKFSRYSTYKRISGHSNRCLMSGRPYGVIKLFSYSRFNIRRSTNQLKISGFGRKSW